MRRYRARRRAGFTVIPVEISDADVRCLVARGYLDRLRSNDPNAVQDALHRWFDASIARG